MAPLVFPILCQNPPVGKYKRTGLTVFSVFQIPIKMGESAPGFCRQIQGRIRNMPGIRIETVGKAIRANACGLVCNAPAHRAKLVAPRVIHHSSGNLSTIRFHGSTIRFPPPIRQDAALSYRPVFCRRRKKIAWSPTMGMSKKTDTAPPYLRPHSICKYSPTAFDSGQLLQFLETAPTSRFDAHLA